MLAPQAQDGLEQRAPATVKQAGAGAQPAVLHERLQPVGADLGDRGLEVDVAARGADPCLQRAAAAHRGVDRQRLGHVLNQRRVPPQGPLGTWTLIASRVPSRVVR